MIETDNQFADAERGVKFSAEHLARFWAKVDKDNGPIIRDELGRCWIWTAGKFTDGYGTISINGKSLMAHRVSYAIHHGHIPSDFLICHACDNPPCVNPSHLWPGTNKDNGADCTAKGRRAKGDRNGMRKHPNRVMRGEDHGKSKLTTLEIEAIRARYSEGKISQKRLAAEFGICKATVYYIVHRKVWAHIA